MRYTSVVLAVSDVDRARRFYQDLFGLELDQDFGINVSFTCGLALQQEFHWLVGIPEGQVGRRTHNMELAFETEDLDGFLEKLRGRPGVEYLGGVTEHGWGQRVVRFHDPDGHLIEVGEDMGAVVRRFLDSGLTPEETAARMDVSLEGLYKLLGGRG